MDRLNPSVLWVGLTGFALYGGVRAFKYCKGIIFHEKPIVYHKDGFLCQANNFLSKTNYCYISINYTKSVLIM